MKVILACRDGPAGHYIAGRLARQNLLHVLIVESGRTARRNKVQRLFRDGAIWKLPARSVNIAMLVAYQVWQNRALRKFVAQRFGEGFPEEIQRLDVDDINDKASKEFLQQSNPDYLVILGTGILRPDIIDIAREATLNIHGGLVPRYRNVHSDLWAYVNDERRNIGTSILLLDEGIDTGDIVCQSPAGVDDDDTLVTARKKNLTTAGDLIGQALTDRSLIANRRSQDTALQEFYPTPGNREFLKLLSISLRRACGF